MWEREERLKKVVLWRLISFVLTLPMTWYFTGSVKEASFFTVVLHATLLVSHYLFEFWWDRKIDNDSY